MILDYVGRKPMLRGGCDETYAPQDSSGDRFTELLRVEAVFVRVVAVTLLLCGGNDLRFRGLTCTFDKPKLHGRAWKSCYHPKALLRGGCLMSLKQCLHMK